jgi:RNA polymerase sigma factor (sigma-70 family)
MIRQVLSRSTGSGKCEVVNQRLVCYSGTYPQAMKDLQTSCDSIGVSAAPFNSAAREFLPTRNTLLSRLKNWDDQESWRDFFDTYWKFLFSIALRSGLSRDEARDVVQETVISVAKALREKRFKSGENGSFKAWLQLIVRRRVADHLRRARARPDVQRPGSKAEALVLGMETLDEVAAPGAEIVKGVWEEEWARNVADLAIENVKRRVGPKQFQMFDLYALKNLPVRQVAEMLDVNVALIYLAKHRVTRLIRKESEKLRQAMDKDGGLGC